jgi:hypothetical protein
LDAGGQIHFAGDGYNRFRPVLQNNSPGQCPARSHSDL